MDLHIKTKYMSNYWINYKPTNVQQKSKNTVYQLVTEFLHIENAFFTYVQYIHNIHLIDQPLRIKHARIGDQLTGGSDLLRFSKADNMYSTFSGTTSVKGNNRSGIFICLYNNFCT